MLLTAIPSIELGLVAVVLSLLTVCIDGDSCTLPSEQLEQPTTLALLQRGQHREPTLIASTSTGHEPSTPIASKDTLSVLSVSAGINYTAAALELAPANHRASAAVRTAIGALQQTAAQQPAGPVLARAAPAAAVAALQQPAAQPPVKPVLAPNVVASAALRLANAQPVPVSPPTALPPISSALLQQAVLATAKQPLPNVALQQPAAPQVPQVQLVVAAAPPVQPVLAAVPRQPPQLRLQDVVRQQPAAPPVQPVVAAASQQPAAPPPVQPVLATVPQEPLPDVVWKQPAAPPPVQPVVVAVPQMLLPQTIADQFPDDDNSPGGFEALVSHAGHGLALPQSGVGATATIIYDTRLEAHMPAQLLLDEAHRKADKNHVDEDSTGHAWKHNNTDGDDSLLGVMDKVQKTSSRMSVLDIASFVGAGVVMFLFLVFADII